MNNNNQTPVTPVNPQPVAPVQPQVNPQTFNPNANPSVQPTPVYGPNVNTTYQQPYQPVNNQPPVDNTPLSPWAYIGYQILFAIPIVGLIMLFVYGFGQGNINRKNFARAYLILMLIGFILGILLVVVFGVSFANAFKNLNFN